MTTNIHAIKSITAMQDERRKGNVRPRGCVQVAFITSDGGNKSQHPVPAAFYAALVLPGYPEECGGEEKGSVEMRRWVKKEKRGRNVATRIVRAACSIFVKRVVAHICLCMYAIFDMFRFICLPKNFIEFSNLRINTFYWDITRLYLIYACM